jgi:hypothetical protein
VVGLDELYCMARQDDYWGVQPTWAAARRGAAALADSFFASGLDAVVIEGEFFTPDECRQLLDSLVSEADEAYFTLLVSYEVVLGRVQGDPARGASRDPEFLKWLHDNFLRALPYLESASVVLRADDPTPEELAALMVDTLPAGAREGAHPGL